MPIKGLTNRELAFPEIGQIRKGAPKTKNAPGKDLKHFRAVFGENEKRAQEKFVKSYGDEPTAIRIILPFNDVDQMWSAYLEAYTAGRMVAKSDGENVLYATNNEGDVTVKDGYSVETGERVPHPKDNLAGTDYKNKPVYFKEQGRLRVIVPELDRAAYMLFVTTSKHDCANIDKQLCAFHALNNGQIAGIPFLLRKSPKEISKPIGGKRVRSTSWLVSIEADPSWVKARLTSLKHSALPAPPEEYLALEAEVFDSKDSPEEVEGEVVPDGHGEFWNAARSAGLDEELADEILSECGNDYSAALQIIENQYLQPE